MDIGELNRRVEILKYFVKRDAYGGEDGRWLPVGRVWAKIKPVSGTSISRRSKSRRRRSRR